MRRIFQLSATVLILSFLAALTSCQKPEEEQVLPELVPVTEGDVTVGWEGGKCQFLYEIKNPTATGVVTPSTEVDWITDFISNSYGVISFTVAENPSEVERTAEVDVAYEDLLLTFTVRQAAKSEMGNSYLKILIEDVKTTSMKVTVTPVDDELTYLVLCSDMESMAGFEDDDLLFEDAMSFYQSMADAYGTSLEDVLSSYILQGVYTDEFSGLESGSEYCVFAFGVSLDGTERLTPIARASATTKEIQEVNVNFSFDIETGLQPSGIGAYAEVRITPSDTEVKYWYLRVGQLEWDIYGQSMPEAAEGYLNWLKNYYIYSDMTLEDIYAMFSVNGTQEIRYDDLECKSNYWISAFAWDEECNLTSDIYWEAFQAPGVESDNVITMQVEDITGTTARVVTQTTNNDPYVICLEPAWRVEGMDDEYLMWSLVDYYDLASQTVTGNQTVEYSDLDPDTDYVALAFGFAGGSYTTGLTRVDFTTGASGEASQCTFEFVINSLTSREVNITVIPSDPSVYYYWEIRPADQTADQIREMYEQDIASQIANGKVADAIEYWTWTAFLRRNDTYSYSLVPGQQFIIMAVAPDLTTGEISTLQVSEVYTAPEPVVSDVLCNLDLSKYYDGDELYAYDPGKYVAFQNKAYLYVQTERVGDVAHWYHLIVPWNDAYDDETKYTDQGFISNLLYSGQADRESTQWICDWDKEYFAIAVAQDSEGNYGVVSRYRFTLTRDNASPIDEIVQSGVRMNVIPMDNDLGTVVGRRDLRTARR